MTCTMAYAIIVCVATQSPPLLEPALELLAKHHDRIDGPEALSLLPPETPIAKLMPFFSATLVSTKHYLRSNQVRGRTIYLSQK